MSINRIIGLVVFFMLGLNIVIPVFDNKNSFASASSTSAKYATAAADRGGVANFPWVSTANAEANDSTYAVATNIYEDNNYEYSSYLHLYTYGFTASDVPAGSTITGIYVVIPAMYGPDGTPTIYVQLVDSTNTRVGTAKSSSLTASRAYYKFGGSSDMWGSSITQSDVVSSNFGVDIRIYCKGTFYDPESDFDSASIIVYYTPAWVNNNPSYSSPSPTDGATGMNRYHSLNITFTDADNNQTERICFWSNTSGSWTHIQPTNNTLISSSGTKVELVNATFASSYSTKYWWKVTDNDWSTNNITSSIYSFTTKAAPITKAWKKIKSGYFLFNNITFYKQQVAGYFNFGNTASWKPQVSGYFIFGNTANYRQITSGWFNFNNVVSYKQIISGYFVFNNIASYKQVLSGWFVFSNVSGRIWKQTSSGHFSFSNAASHKQVSSGWFLFNNAASFKQQLSGYFSFGNTVSFKQTASGYFIFGNTISYKTVSSGWFIFRNTSSAAAWKNTLQGYFYFGNIASYKQDVLGYFNFGNAASYKQAASGYFIFNNPVSYKQSVSGWFVFRNTSANRTWNQATSGYLRFSNNASYKQSVSGYFNFNNMAVFRQIRSGYFLFHNVYSGSWQQSASGYFRFENTVNIGCSFSYSVTGCNIYLSPTLSTDVVSYQWIIEPSNSTTILGRTGWIPSSSIFSQMFSLDYSAEYRITLLVKNSTGVTNSISKFIYTPRSSESVRPAPVIVPSSSVNETFTDRFVSWFNSFPPLVRIGFVLIVVFLGAVCIDVVFHLSKGWRKKIVYKVKEKKK